MRIARPTNQVSPRRNQQESERSKRSRRVLIRLPERFAEAKLQSPKPTPPIQHRQRPLLTQMIPDWIPNPLHETICRYIHTRSSIMSEERHAASGPVLCRQVLPIRPRGSSEGNGACGKSPSGGMSLAQIVGYCIVTPFIPLQWDSFHRIPSENSAERLSNRRIGIGVCAITHVEPFPIVCANCSPFWDQLQIIFDSSGCAPRRCPTRRRPWSSDRSPCSSV